MSPSSLPLTVSLGFCPCCPLPQAPMFSWLHLTALKVSREGPSTGQCVVSTFSCHFWSIHTMVTSMGLKKSLQRNEEMQRLVMVPATSETNANGLQLSPISYSRATCPTSWMQWQCAPNCTHLIWGTTTPTHTVKAADPELRCLFWPCGFYLDSSSSPALAKAELGTPATALPP